MTPQQIKEAEERAVEVISGFKQPNRTTANDVLRLVAAIRDQGRLIIELQDRPKPAQTKTPMPNEFEQLFGRFKK